MGLLGTPTQKRQAAKRQVERELIGQIQSYAKELRRLPDVKTMFFEDYKSLHSPEECPSFVGKYAIHRACGTDVVHHVSPVPLESDVC